MLRTMLADNVKARTQMPDGTYKILPSDREPLNSQEKFFDDAYAAANRAE